MQLNGTVAQSFNLRKFLISISKHNWLISAVKLKHLFTISHLSRHIQKNKCRRKISKKICCKILTAFEILHLVGCVMQKPWGISPFAPSIHQKVTAPVIAPFYQWRQFHQICYCLTSFSHSIINYRAINEDDFVAETATAAFNLFIYIESHARHP